MGKTTNDNNNKPKAPAKKSNPTKAKASSSPSRKGFGGPQKILDFLLFMETSTGNPNVTRKQVAAMSGVKTNTFTVTISCMKKKGLIEYGKEFMRLTEEGRAKANPVAGVSMDNGSTQDDIKQKFKIGGKAAALFEILKDGKVHDRETVIGELGFGSKASAAVMLCNLKKNGVIDYDKSTIKLTDMCFPLGRPEPSE
jgi:Mn-dependent DtxR family transcriptional regulator